MRPKRQSELNKCIFDHSSLFKRLLVNDSKYNNLTGTQPIPCNCGGAQQGRARERELGSWCVSINGRAWNGRAGVNGIARRQHRARAWSELVSINGRARQRVRALSWRASINGRAQGARERGRESISLISKFKSSLKSSVVAPYAVVSSR